MTEEEQLIDIESVFSVVGDFGGSVTMELANGAIVYHAFYDLAQAGIFK
ncbi:Hypothetical protein DHA2_8004 [Giardia duodenalis]|uniref:Uncharacterized protein n=1 Tax=Giardia intestinalis TaxID=5741 RepID=V6T7M7_GIAIN|nr:Hypothetical protein DHA2_8004 [Giardia intestinalis]